MMFTSQCPSSNPKHAFYNKYEMEAKQIISALQAYKFIQEHSWLHKMEFQLNTKTALGLHLINSHKTKIEPQLRVLPSQCLGEGIAPVPEMISLIG